MAGEWSWSKTRTRVEYAATAFAVLVAAVGVAIGVHNVVIVVIAAFVALYAVRLVRMPTRIRMRDDGVVEFANPFREIAVPVGDIKSIAVQRRARKGGEIVVRYGGGKLRMLNWFGDFETFVRDAREQNPDIAH